MPKYNKKKDDDIIKSELQTNTGLYIHAGEIQKSDYDLTSWEDLQKDYYKMRDSDGLVSTTVDILKYPILMSDYKIESKNKEVQDYLYWIFNNLSKGFQNFKYHKLLALDFGLSMFEVIIKRAGKFNGKLTNYPIYFNPIQNETINRFHYNEQTIFTGIKHEKRIPENSNVFIDIDTEDLEWFTYNEEFNDIRGRAIYRPIRIFWDAKHKIINSKVTATQRGAGIPIIYTKGEPSSADKQKIETIGRTICQLKNGYVSANEEKIKIELVEPKSNQDVIQLLTYLDSQMFFNTLTQFTISGIGQNGSRAATSEHKTSYELFANYILQSFDKNMTQLCNRIIEMSYLTNIIEEEKPVFISNSIASRDLKTTSEYLTNISNIGLTSPRDRDFLRAMFNLPEESIKITEESQQEVSEEDKSQMHKMHKRNERKLSQEHFEFEKNIFSLNSAIEHYEITENKTKNKLEEIIGLYFEDIKRQLNKNRKRAINISQSLMQKAIDDLTELYVNGYNRGNRDIKTEVNKLNKTNKLALEPSNEKRVNKKIDRLINKLFFNIKSSIENKMERVSDSYIAQKGGLNEFLVGFETGFKKEKDSISSEVESGYVDGRGETLLDLSEDIETYFYSARLDSNLCDNCAPFDGAIFTRDEIDEKGLNFGQPINPDCLGNLSGNDRCRCNWIPYSIRSR